MPWFVQLSQELVLTSKSAAIRACNLFFPKLMTLFLSFFPLTMISIFENVGGEERMNISQYFTFFVNNPKTPHKVLDAIASTCDTVNRAGFDFFKVIIVLEVLQKKICHGFVLFGFMNFLCLKSKTL
jgi:hypothetical protein